MQDMQHFRGKKLVSISTGLIRKSSHLTLPAGVSYMSDKSGIFGQILASNFCEENHLITSFKNYPVLFSILHHFQAVTPAEQKQEKQLFELLKACCVKTFNVFQTLWLYFGSEFSAFYKSGSKV